MVQPRVLRRRSLSYWLARFRNGTRKVFAGLTPFGESVWPGVRNDLFVAHESIYHFFSKYALGKSVLDAGCGTGYGADILLGAGARSVFGVDIDRRSVRYARRHTFSPGATFASSDLDAINLQNLMFDLVVSSNVLEHLREPENFLRSLEPFLTARAVLLIALPPITSPESLAVHDGIHYHRSNLTIDEWIATFTRCHWRVELFAHRYCGAGPAPDFSSPFRSVLAPSDFAVGCEDRNRLYESPPTTAIYLLSRAA